jgi:glutamine amidotransferase
MDCLKKHLIGLSIIGGWRIDNFVLGVVDFKNSNSRSISNTLDYLEIPNIRSLSVQDLNQASGLIIPGVGAFGALVEQLSDETLVEFIISKKNLGIPFLGVCLGMQIMFECSEESENVSGLNWIPGRMQKMKTSANIRVPHVGWNSVYQIKDNPIFADIPNDSDFFFCHSYKVNAANDSVIGWTNHGENFGSVVTQENLFGAQFHPEKSQIHGLQFLKNFEKIVRQC